MSAPDRSGKPSRPLKSFRDLKRALGGAEPEPEPTPAGRGWTFAGDEQALESAAASGDGARAIVLARPRAFGPMAGGPPCYLEEDSEELELLHSFRVRTIFPGDVQAEVATLPRDPAPADLAGRLDLRGHTIFTVDGEDAKDFDDAIEIAELEGGRLEVGVHIADVAHYVRPGTALDAEGLARATSIYLPDQVVPMLPEALSNHLCSLVEGRERLCYSVRMVFDAAGQRLEASVAKSVIKSVKRCTYKGVQELLDGADTPLARELAFLERPLRLFERWTKRQQAIRDAKGSLRMTSRERRFVFDERHEVSAVVDYPRYFSMALIEETALAANQAVGDLFRSRGLPAIYRVHREKDPEEVAAVAKMLEEHQIRVPDKDRLTARDVGRMIRAARRRPNAEALIQRIMGLVERATYEVHDHEDVAKHFGLARQGYLHFTSPIRRYPDLMVHRWLWAVESRGSEAETELRAAELLADLNQVASHCSGQAEVAEMVAQAVGDLKVCQFMHPHIGKKLSGKVHRVSPAGLEVHLTDFNVVGFLPSRTLGERARVEGPTLTVRKGRQVRSFTEGHPVAVRLADVDFVRLQLMMELA
ncbi:MAG TPA: RNB domain-containing ribonuclease [Planctomycetota bacterium]|nr:RNB domain-containing ribonuclease [Planctomycetota bacterium]